MGHYAMESVSLDIPYERIVKREYSLVLVPFGLAHPEIAPRSTIIHNA